MLEKRKKYEKLMLILFCIVLMIVAFSAGRLTSISRILPENAATVQRAIAYSDGMNLERQHAFTADETSEFLTLWHNLDWKADKSHKNVKNVESEWNVRYSFTILYVNQWMDTSQHYWIYFCDDNTMILDSGIGDKECYVDESGKYDKLLKFFSGLKYMRYDEAGNPILEEEDVEAKRQELEAEVQRMQEELERLNQIK